MRRRGDRLLSPVQQRVTGSNNSPSRTWSRLRAGGALHTLVWLAPVGPLTGGAQETESVLQDVYELRLALHARLLEYPLQMRAGGMDADPQFLRDVIEAIRASAGVIA